MKKFWIGVHGFITGSLIGVGLGTLIMPLFTMLMVSCHTLSPSEKIERDLIGQTTGGRESSWKFQHGQVYQVKILQSQGYVTIVSLESDAGYGRFYQILKLTYNRGGLQSVGQLYIQKIGL